MTQRPDGFATLVEAAEAVAAYTQHRRRATDLKGLEKNLRRGADGRYRWHWDPRFVGPGGPAGLLDREGLMAAAGRIRVPTLLVRGRESDVLSVEGADELLAVVSGSEFEDVSGAGHMVAGDRNDAFTAAVVAFLERRVPA
jgi:pimeloyl-ACP methyl ester carboxylesterase